MTKFFLLIPALLIAVVSLLTMVRAPDWILAWKLSILVDEYGHWLVLLPLALAIAAGINLAGAWRIVTLAVCVVAMVCLLRPIVSARRVAATLPEGLRAAFGPRDRDRSPLSLGRLYGGSPKPKAAMRTEIFARPDGHELKMDIYLSGAVKDTFEKPRPCVVVVHGGGWDSGDRFQLPHWNHWMVSKGYVVAAISYRLAPRWQWPAPNEDVLASIAWLKAHAVEYGIDPKKFVLLGRSAGGQIAAAVGYGAHDPAIRGVVALYAPHDMPFVWSVSREDDVLNSLNLMRQYMGGPPDAERKALYDSASPQFLAAANSPPTLLIHGDPDTLSWVRHSERLSTHLEELHVPHYFLRLPWATHAFDFNLDGPSGQLTDYSLEWFLASVTK